MPSSYVQHGFTLIELMIVVAIISVLAAIAIPSYQEYILRTQMTRALAELNSLRSALEVCESDGSLASSCQLDNVSSDMLIDLPTVTYNPSAITASFGRNANSKLQGGTIAIRRSANSGWVCTMSVSTVSPRLIPRACR